MNIGRELKRCLIAMGLLLLGSGLWGQDRPLPEVARQKPGRTATRVFTNEDLEAGRPADEAATTAAEEPAREEEASVARITVPGLLEEASLKQARAILESLQRDEQVLLRRYVQIQEKLRSESDQHLRQLYSSSLARREETLGRKREQIKEVERAIAAAESRRASPPRSQHENKTGVEK